LIENILKLCEVKLGWKIFTRAFSWFEGKTYIILNAHIAGISIESIHIVVNICMLMLNPL